MREGDLVTQDILNGIGIDSVSIIKLDDISYSINFKEIGSYSKFKERYKS